MHKLVWIGLGGCMGAILRYGVGCLAQSMSCGRTFPLATLGVNIVGSFIMGLLYCFTGVERGGLRLSDDMRGFLMVGGLGAFTTFSSFSNETLTLWNDGSSVLALLNVTLNVILALAACVCGRGLGNWLIRVL